MSAGSRMVPRTALLAVVLMGLAGCATTGRDRADSPPGTVPIVDPPVRAGLPTLLVAMPASPNFMDVRKTLVSEVQKNFNVKTFTVSPKTESGDLAAAIRAAKPNCLVLMNNATMNLYRQIQQADPASPALPAVLLMAAFLEEVQPLIRRSTGIAYEVPGVTAFMNLRSVTATPVNRIGVVYRPAFRKFIERQKVLAAREHVEIIAAGVPNDVTAGQLRDVIHELATREKVDAMWMLNDNILVRDDV
ncbi:MAG: hypothetical protein ABUL77_00815, partial [Bacteroidota bacterium]